MKLSDLLPILNEISPLHLAQEWDNVGLIAGNIHSEVRRILLTIDLTHAVFQEALAIETNLIIAYHPPVFDAIKRLNSDSLIYQSIAKGISLYSPHTALDVAPGGTNDVLAGVLGLSNSRPLQLNPADPWHYKLVVFVPGDRVNQLSEALFTAGAGWIGNYSHCSFRAEGTGTFLGQAGTNPTIGKPGLLEHTPEVRLETIVPREKLSAVVAALRKTHPYEEPAFDIIQLTQEPLNLGIGRIGTVKPIARKTLIGRIKKTLGLKSLLIAGPVTGQVRTVACCAGACGNLLNMALAQKADLLLTGEVRHHDALKAAAAGMTVVSTLHSNSERIALTDYAARLHKATGLDIRISSADKDPFVIG